MKLRNILFAVALPLAAFLASCGGSEEEKAKPSIALSNTGGSIVTDALIDSGGFAKFTIVANSNDDKLSKLTISQSVNGGTSGNVKDTTLNSKTLNYVYNYSVRGRNGDKIKVTCTVTDKNGETASTSITITVKVIGDALGEETGQEVFNIIGVGKGAYDLNTSSPKASTDPDAVKDLKDLTTVANPTFSKKWGSGHGNSKFAVITDKEYTDAAFEGDITTLWAAKSASATSQTPVLADGTCLIVKTGQSGVAFDYYVIKVTSVVDGAGNDDKIVFSFKKK